MQGLLVLLRTRKMYLSKFRFIEKIWYEAHVLRWPLRPLSWVYQSIVFLRRNFLKRFCQSQFAVPVIVVGNLTVGGVGKTPLVMALVKAIQKRGLRVGVVSRGYGASIKQFPHEVDAAARAAEVGDEPLLLARNCACPVVIAPKRVDAVKYLLEKHQCQIIISDDGLQHYAMGRAIEIVVVDGSRFFGNKLCLPAGPLRERPSRLDDVDFIVVNAGQMPGAYAMELKAGPLRSLTTQEPVDLATLARPIAAIAGIGNPERFFKTLRDLSLTFRAYAFPDHYRFNAEDLKFKEKTVLMTEKDAVKCQPFAKENCFVLPVEAELSPAFWQAFWSHEKLKGFP